MERAKQPPPTPNSSWEGSERGGLADSYVFTEDPPPYEDVGSASPSPTSSVNSLHRARARPLPPRPPPSARSSSMRRLSSTLDDTPSRRSSGHISSPVRRVREPLPRLPSSSTLSDDTPLPSYSQPATRVSVPLASSLLSTAVDLSRLSHVAQLLSFVLPRQPLIQGSVMYPLSFTGRTLVTTLAEMLSQYVHISQYFTMSEALLLHAARPLALSIARSLKTQLFVHEADWEDRPITDNVGGVFMLYSDRIHTDKHGPAQVALPGLDAELFCPTPWHAVALSPVAAAAAATAPAQELPTGLVTPLMRCYSPTCALTHGATCYSPSCPRTKRVLLCEPEEIRDTTDTVAAAAWVETVPAALVASLPREEVKRQNAVHEFVQKEEAFLRDLELLREWEERLRQRSTQATVGLLDDAPLRGPALDAFVHAVFGPVAALQAHIHAFVDRLLERQREEAPVVQRIADVVVRAALEWADAYTDYVAHYPHALARLKAEVAVNVRLRRFFDDCRRDPAAGRHALDHFLFRPPARLQRYHLHLASIAKHTPPDTEEAETLSLAMSIIDEQCLKAQSGVAAAEMQLRLRFLADQLEAKRADVFVDLDLRNPQRQVVFEAPLYRRPDNFEFEWTEMHGILLDNYLILAKPKHEDSELGGPSGSPAKLVYSKRPIPVPCLDAGGFHDPPVGRSSVGRRMLPTDVHAMYPFSVWHRFRPALMWTLYAPSEDARRAWRDALMRSSTACDKAPGLVQRCDQSGDTFSPSVAPPGSLLSLRDTTPLEVTCTDAWSLANGTSMLAIGTSEGVWLGREGQPSSIHKVLHVRGVTQCAVLVPYRRLLVLADRTLWAYDLEALVPSGSSAPSLTPLRLSHPREVQFFAIGQVDGRLYLVYAKRKTTETSVRVMVPVASVASERQPATLTGVHVLHVRDSTYSEILRVP